MLYKNVVLRLQERGEKSFTLFHTIVSPGVMLWLKDSLTEDWRHVSRETLLKWQLWAKFLYIAITISLWIPPAYFMETELWQMGCS